MAEQIKNSLDVPTSVLNSGISSGALSLTVTAGHGSRFPATGNFRVKLTDQVSESLYELVICTARAGDVLTITRAAEGTTARAFNVGDPVDLVLSAAGLTNYIAENSSYLSVVSQGAVGDGTTDDTAAIQATIDACPDGGTVFLPVGVFKLTDALSITKNIALVGSGVGAVMGTADQSGLGMLPTIDPYLVGSVLLPSTAGQNAIEITGTQISVTLRDFGIRFDDAIMFVDTGHGVYSAPSAVRLTGHELGVYNGFWENVSVFGHDGDHYGFYIQNALFGTFTHLRSYGGGGLMLEGEMDGCATGNLTVVNPYVCQIVGDSTDCYKISGTRLGINLLEIFRPCAVFGGAPAPFDVIPGIVAPVAGQHLWRHDGNYDRISIYDPDLEGPDHPIDFGGDNKGVIVRPGGILLASNAEGLVFSTQRLAVDVDTALTVTAGAGAGVATGGAASFPFGARDAGCRIRIETGTAPGGAGSLICSVEFGIVAFRDYVLLQPAESLEASLLGLYVVGLSSTGFDVYAQEPLAASTTYDVFFYARRSFE